MSRNYQNHPDRYPSVAAADPYSHMLRPMDKPVVSPSFEHWHMDMLDGDEDLWRHLHSMERGDEGRFNQLIFLAMDKADSANKQKLYTAFFDHFNPR